eukprot:Protomagalhaensia_sp_Gyna_25__3786@NODE_33_length_6954_cov_98_369776_g23_i0_p8_GENE_NODE_33_length_6954_cov_98_369776_g23_i0NODE_33_length_6954_cov_98_369776_g23_i0_p8_ORF_typecomplete_len103_score1_65Moco_dimer/PF03404_16/0_018_NODE_33_length_6954_cov_98_369776_g23_i050315339
MFFTMGPIICLWFRRPIRRGSSATKPKMSRPTGTACSIPWLRWQIEWSIDSEASQTIVVRSLGYDSRPQEYTSQQLSYTTRTTRNGIHSGEAWQLRFVRIRR